MTYSIKKYAVGQECVKKVTLFLNQCKYSAGSFLTAKNGYTNDFLDDTYTGVMVALGLSTGLVATWGGMTVYLRIVATLEIVRCSIGVDGTFTILERGILGTTPDIIDGDFTVHHLGELDGSCKGFSQTCSNADSYVDGLYKEVVFSSHPLPSGDVFISGLDFKSARYESPEIKVGESIGSRARLSVTLYDQVHDDYGVVPYEGSRSSGGTLFGKLIARNPHFSGRKIVYSEGLRATGSFVDPDWVDRSFIIDDIDFSAGEFSITALDPLILTEGKKAKMPLASTAQLSAAITGTPSTITFVNASAGYFGVSGNLIVRIDSECIEVTATGTTTLNVVTRGYGNTQVKDHSAGATIQNCIRFVDEHVVDVITYALETWTSVPAAYIDDYSSVIAATPTIKLSDYTITAPTDVVDVINKCIFLGNLIFYFDNITNKIVIKYIKELDISPIYLDDDENFKRGSVSRTLRYQDQHTRFNLSWAPYDITKDSDLKNMQVSLTGINITQEGPTRRNEINERKSMVMPLLNASGADYLVAVSAIDRIVSAAGTIPETLKVTLDAQDVGDDELQLGDIVSIRTAAITDSSGVPTPSLFQAVKIEGDAYKGFDVKLNRYLLYEPSDSDFTITSGVYANYVLSDHFAPAAGTYTVYIESGAIFFSASTSEYAFDTGPQASGVTLRFISRWQVYGQGGAGGNCGFAGTLSAEDGHTGGSALNIRCDCTIDNGAGLIWAGGGGGAGDLSVVILEDPLGDDIWSAAAGGGGGQGYALSYGGDYTLGSTSGSPSVDGQQSNGSRAGGGDGNYGGAWGEAGANSSYGGVGGAAGVAINKNGYNVDIISGNNSTAIRGRIV